MNDITTVKTVDIESIDDLFGGADAESVIVPEESKKTVLTQEEEINLDPKELNKPEPKETVKPAQIPPAESGEGEPAGDDDTDDPLSFEELVETNQDENKKAGRAKTDKSGIVELFKKKIEGGTMFPFDDFKDGDDIDEYLSNLSMKDLEELWDANESRRIQEIEEKVPQEFYNSLPRELQFAAKYVADGGGKLKELFKALADSEEVKELDPEKDSRQIAQQYLKATNFGTDEEIEDQLNEWEDLGVMAKKASLFKPKLDKMHEQIIENKLLEQENKRIEREKAAQQYVENVTTSLKDPEIAGIKLDNKTHQFLVQGLLQPVYPSITGKNTNLLGHLLEKHQVVQPNYNLVAEALWLLSDPEGYRSKIGEKYASKKIEPIVRELKTEYNRGTRSASSETVRVNTGTVKRVQRAGNILKR